jgi:hypothetical protein
VQTLLWLWKDILRLHYCKLHYVRSAALTMCACYDTAQSCTLYRGNLYSAAANRYVYTIIYVCMQGDGSIQTSGSRAMDAYRMMQTGAKEVCF